MANITYMRRAKSLPDPEAQQQLLRAAGVTELDTQRDRAYLDVPKRQKVAAVDFTERDRAIRACRQGDELWVSHAFILGTNAENCLDALRQIAERGAVLRIAATGGRHVWTPDAVSALDFARQVEADTRLNRTTKAQLAARARQERTRAAEDRSWKKARSMWTDLQFTVKQITEATGLKVRTLYNAVDRGDFPPRNAQPFTGGPRAKRRGR